VRPADPFTTSKVDVGNERDRHHLWSGRDGFGAGRRHRHRTVQLQQAKLVERSVAGALYRADGGLRLGLLAFGPLCRRLARRTRRDHRVAAHRHAQVAGRLELSARSPGPGSTATLHFTQTATGEQFTYRIKPGETQKISIPMCSSTPVTLGFTAGPLGGLGDGRGVAARTSTPHFVRDASACPAQSSGKTPHRSNG
jgi:hypothetical protein